jgi:phosphate transport system ATP-binding protein
MTEQIAQNQLEPSEEREQVMTETSETSANATVEEPATSNAVFDVEDLAVYYGTFKAVRDATFKIRPHEITALIGPSGCGKSSVLRCFNRMNDTIPGARVEGSVKYHGIDLYGPNVSATQVRRHIGMVFQKPNPFPKSIFDNVAYGPRIAGMRKKSELDDVVEESLRSAALWDEVKDRLKASGLGLSGGQQQRLCIARALAVQPDVILMDEPCSALDPIATARIEDLMQEIKSRYFTTEVSEAGDRRTGVLVEFGRTSKMFSNPSDKRTEAYVTGRFG